jgi:hypothetical protein
VIAVQGLESGQEFDPDFLSGATHVAEPLALGEGDSRTLDLRVRQP